MEIYAKRTPAFCRALLDSDSEESDGESESIYTELIPSHASIGDKPLSHLLITLGPFATYFVNTSLGLDNQKEWARFQCRSANDFLHSFVLYHTADGSNGPSLVISYQVEATEPLHEYKVAVHKLLDLILPAHNLDKLKTVCILSSVPGSRFLSPSPPQLPFIRKLCSGTNSNQSLVKYLEHPNILSSLPAEFSAWFHFKSIPYTVYTVFYSSNVNYPVAWPACKEIFNLMKVLSKEIQSIQSNCTDWDGKQNGKLLAEDCIKLICGNKPTKMDQMYS